jgi:hypothetical protein
MRQHNIAMATIKDIQRLLEDSPARESSEVSKVQALRLLAPQILLMQSKGYSAAHIAGLLSERGVVVTAATLKSHLSRFKTAEAQEALRAKPAKRTNRETTLPATSSRAVAPPMPTAPATVATTAAPSPPSKEATEPAKRPAPSTVPDLTPRRSGFTVRPDTKDI